MNEKSTLEHIKIFIEEKNKLNKAPLNISLKTLQCITKKEQKPLRDDLNKLYSQKLIKVREGINDKLIYLV